MMIKICGIVSRAMAEAAKEAGADWIGFVFAGSKRQIDSAAARDISRSVPGIGKVGVFVNAPLTEVQEIARQCKLDYVQLHGEESAAYCRSLSLPVIKAVRAQSLSIEEVNAYPADWILLDSVSGKQFGGTGVSFAWQELQKVRRHIAKPLLIAGGLHAGNVREASGLLVPDGVDVSGGVELNGVKSAEKIYEFIRTVRKGEAHA